MEVLSQPVAGAALQEHRKNGSSPASVCGPRRPLTGGAAVLSILDPEAPVHAELAAFATHGRLELRFSDVIDEQPDMQCPRHEQIDCLVLFVQLPVDEWPIDTHLLIHRNAGFSRSPAYAVLVSEEVLLDIPSAEYIGDLLCIRNRM